MRGGGGCMYMYAYCVDERESIEGIMYIDTRVDKEYLYIFIYP